MAPESSPQRRTRGRIERLPSGSLRVVVYAGIDPISKRRHYLQEVVPAGPRAAKEAEKVRTRLLAEVDERRNPRTKASVRQLMERYLDVLTIEDTTRVGYERLVRLHIEPLLGDLPLGRVDGETLDSFYKELRRCRAHCHGRRFVQHRTDGTHECDDRCGPHRCKPLGDSSIRQIHNILNGAFARAVRWRWIGTNPVKQAHAPSQPSPDPQPPTPAQAARIVQEAWADSDWGMLVWLAMTTGARRGELCALRWNRVDFVTGILDIRSSIAQTGSRVWEKDTKTHQCRRIVLDPQTLALLRAYLQHCAERASSLDLALAEDAFLFSPEPHGGNWLKPDTVTQRYTRMCARLGWDMHLHQLRHFSATELIAAGVDVRTVAGRLGHGGGGTTTLRVYSAWVAEADQRAAALLATRLPALSSVSLTPNATRALPAATERSEEPNSPYQQIAADLRAAIRCGALRPGDHPPTVKELSERYGVSVGTAHRALALLSEAGLIDAKRGRRAVVTTGAGLAIRIQVESTG
jgi:integrase